MRIFGNKKPIAKSSGDKEKRYPGRFVGEVREVRTYDIFQDLTGKSQGLP